VTSPEPLVRAAVRALEPYAWELSSEAVAARHHLPVGEILRFDLNTSPFRPAGWEQVLEEERQSGTPNEYFDTSYTELIPLFAAYCGVSEDEVIVGAGADEVLDIVAKTFLDNGDAVVVSPPTYAMYAIVSAQMGARIRRAPLDPAFGLDVEAILAAARGAKLIWVCTPNSPTGTPPDPQRLARIVDEAPCMVVVDEAYGEYASWSAVPLVRSHPNLIVVKTMSKAFAMAGMRLGWGIAQAEVVGVLNRVRPPNSVARITARLGAAALRNLATMRGNVAAVVAQREPLAEALRRAGARVHPSATNFLLAGWESPARAQAIADWLESRGLVVRNYARDPDLPGHLRITVRTAEQNARLMAALAERDRAAIE
jgi:histidinol-phosphate aminotransferase